MGFHVYVEKQLEQKLEAMCIMTGKKRNAIVREALKEYINAHYSVKWPESVLSFKPVPDFRRFEDNRNELNAPREDIF